MNPFTEYLLNVGKLVHNGPHMTHRQLVSIGAGALKKETFNLLKFWETEKQLTIEEMTQALENIYIKNSKHSISYKPKDDLAEILKNFRKEIYDCAWGQIQIQRMDSYVNEREETRYIIKKY